MPSSARGCGRSPRAHGRVPGGCAVAARRRHWVQCLTRSRAVSGHGCRPSGEARDGSLVRSGSGSPVNRANRIRGSPTVVGWSRSAVATVGVGARRGIRTGLVAALRVRHAALRDDDRCGRRRRLARSGEPAFRGPPGHTDPHILWLHTCRSATGWGCRSLSERGSLLCAARSVVTPTAASSTHVRSRTGRRPGAAARARRADDGSRRSRSRCSRSSSAVV